MPRRMARKARREEKLPTAPARILIATDFSEDAEWALEIGRRLAASLGAEIVLLHVTEPMVEVARSDQALRRRQTVGAALLRSVRWLRARGARADYRVRVGVPADEIIDSATQDGAMLIVIGTRGRRAPVAALLGGVAYNVIRRAPCPVLTVRRQHAVRGSARRRSIAMGSRVRRSGPRPRT
jgi:nucleotide-binding universal stress UspA family protein